MEYGCYNLRLWRFSHGWGEGEEGGELCLSRRKSKQQNKHETQIYDFISFFYETISCFSNEFHFRFKKSIQFNGQILECYFIRKMFSVCGILQHFFRNISKELSESLLTLTFFCNISKNQVTKKYHNSFVLSK